VTLHAAFRLRGGVDAPAEARRRVVGENLVSDALLEDVLLMLSEVVTNAISHGQADERSEVGVEVVRRGTRTTFRVTDDGPGFRPTDRPPDGDHHGFGLLVVDRLAHRWGVARSDGRTCVWFEVCDGAPRAMRRTDEADDPPVEDGRAGGRFEVEA
jgi:anti-sigma regulatory factor (Ser/Thr protein kinase)